MFSLLLRAYRITSPMFRGNEIEKIFQEFRKLGYPNYVMNKVHSEVKTKFFAVPTGTTNEPEERERGNHVSLPFNDFTNSIIQPVLKRHNVHVHYKSSNSLRNNLVKNKPKKQEPDHKSPGVYMIPCKTQGCDRKYFGQTGRTMAARVGEHKYAWRSKNSSNAVASHMINDSHDVDFSGAKLVYKSRDLEKRLTVESLLLSELPNFNNLGGARILDKASRSLVLKDFSQLKKLCPNR